ncbi:MAG: hypothetical protein QOJ92_2727 [Frankiales bacterium]|jgi:hypothetical protein|nr:hypothetical protein [Frankiales bacterium]
MPRVAYVTSELGLDDEVDLVCPALDWEPVLWTDPAVEWPAYSLVVCRSPWDYTWRREEFVDWARRVGAATRLLNPAEVLISNTDKTYLRGLTVPVVPTLWEVPTQLPWREVVVKPAVSAGARDTIRTSSLAEAQAHAAAIEASGKTVMIQPYLDATESEGETSIVWFGDEPSHAVRKPPMLVPDAGADPRYDIRSRELSDELVDFSDRVLGDIPQRKQLLYARVDVIRSSDGALQLMELELTEPYLFLRESEGALDRLAAAADRLAR